MSRGRVGFVGRTPIFGGGKLMVDGMDFGLSPCHASRVKAITGATAGSRGDARDM
jgi:hypothetical protein